MFKRILVPLDGSQLAEVVLPHVAALVGSGQTPHETSVALLQVLDPSTAAIRARTIDPLDWQIYKAEADAYVREVSGRLEAAGMTVSAEVLEGKAAEMIVDYASTISADLILVSSHGQSGISGWNVSSVVQKIIQIARTSVMIVRSYEPGSVNLTGMKYQRIMVPLDGSQRAESALPIAEDLARQNDAELVLAHVIQQPAMPRRMPLSGEDQELANRLVERNRLEAEHYFADLQNRLRQRLDIRLLIHRSIMRALHDLASHEKIDLVVMSAHGYTGETKWRYGSVVVSFIVYGAAPLLIIQDLPADLIEPTEAEVSAKRFGGR